MFILFKRYGKSRHFKKYDSFERLQEEINKGHNEKFPGNTQFFYNTDSKTIEIVNRRLSMSDCLDYLSGSLICNEVTLQELKVKSA